MIVRKFKSSVIQGGFEWAINFCLVLVRNQLTLSFLLEVIRRVREFC